MTPLPPLPRRSMTQRGRVPYPSLGWICKQPSRFIAFGLGVGLLRPASGTWGTLFAWLTWYLLPPVRSDFFVGVFLVVAFLYGAWACQRVGKALNHPDHVGMVWDEIVAFWFVLWLVPATIWAQACAFLLFRLFDITKPPPIRSLDAQMKNGMGVMLDDVLAAGYTLLVMMLAVHGGVF